MSDSLLIPIIGNIPFADIGVGIFNAIQEYRKNKLSKQFKIHMLSLFNKDANVLADILLYGLLDKYKIDLELDNMKDDLIKLYDQYNDFIKESQAFKDSILYKEKNNAILQAISRFENMSKDEFSKALQNNPIFSLENQIRKIIRRIDYFTLNCVDKSRDLNYYATKNDIIIGIRVHDSKLTFIPESIGSLKSLEWLDLKSNHLSSIPESIGNLKSLRKLDLSDNQLNSLPKSFSNLKNNGCKIIGCEVTFQIKNSSEPKKLNIDYRLFNYNCFRIGFFQIVDGNLKQSKIDNGKYSGFIRLNNKKNQPICENLMIPPEFDCALEQIFIGVEICRFPEEILEKPEILPPKIFHFNGINHSWEEIQQSDSYNDIINPIKRFKGIPLRIEEAIALESINNQLIQENKDKFKSKSLRDPIESTGFFTSNNHVFEISLQNCGIDKIPKEIGNLPWLRYLNLQRNKIKFLPKEISYCKNLQQINIWSNYIKNIDPLSDLPNITHLFAGDNQIEYIPSKINGWNSLNTLRLEQNQIKTMPKSMEKLNSLKNLILYENQIIRIPDFLLGSNFDFKELDFNNNKDLVRDNIFHELEEKYPYTIFKHT